MNSEAPAEKRSGFSYGVNITAEGRFKPVLGVMTPRRAGSSLKSGEGRCTPSPILFKTVSIVGAVSCDLAKRGARGQYFEWSLALSFRAAVELSSSCGWYIAPRTVARGVCR